MYSKPVASKRTNFLYFRLSIKGDNLKTNGEVECIHGEFVSFSEPVYQRISIKQVSFDVGLSK